jgi:hypothetical protein
MRQVNEKSMFNLSDIQEKLGVEQHKLIHLCEKNVIIPGLGDSAGRGSMRRFSERNLFEFAVALELRRYQLPLGFIAPIIRILEAFESYAAKDLEVFSLPHSLQEKAAVQLHLIISQGSKLVFSIKAGKSETFLGSIDLEAIGESKKISLSGMRKSSDDPRPKCTSFVEIDLNMIARSLI